MSYTTLRQALADRGISFADAKREHDHQLDEMIARQASSPGCIITSAMIVAGLAELPDHIELGPYSARDVVASIFKQMSDAATRAEAPSCLPPPAHQ